MTRYALLISARAEAAFFAQTCAVAQAELAGLDPEAHQELRQHGAMTMIEVETAAIPKDLASLATIHGIFEVEADALRPLDHSPAFQLHQDFVYGEKYRGKTNETLTQLLINVALQAAGKPAETCTLLDPMCGRGTSLLWAMRYGMRATGIDQDPTVLRDLHRSLKKWTKLHRQKHKLSEGWVQKINKRSTGKYLDFSAQTASLRVVIGETSAADDLCQRKRFDLIVTDLPYGIEHRAGRDQRSPLEIVSRAAPVWAKALAAGGAMAIAFNAYLPKRPALLAAFDGLGLEIIDRPLSHRMSEAIRRDVLILKAPDPT